MMWSGTVDNIPQGWVVCDGDNGTPDLRDRFLLGAGGKKDTTHKKAGTPGGSKSVTLQEQNMPSHTHTANVTDPGHSHSIDRILHESSTDEDDDSLPVYRRNRESNISTENAKTGISVSLESTGGGQPFDIIPPYYALCFIMKL
ncbi:MAG: hypothetical protein F6K47_41915 [Symploca sp. SIO2E6]|nr:hypothetical protein [Symploca sp. SIO2E6]